MGVATNKILLFTSSYRHSLGRRGLIVLLTVPMLVYDSCLVVCVLVFFVFLPLGAKGLSAVCIYGTSGHIHRFFLTLPHLCRISHWNCVLFIIRVTARNNQLFRIYDDKNCRAWFGPAFWVYNGCRCLNVGF